MLRGFSEHRKTPNFHPGVSGKGFGIHWASNEQHRRYPPAGQQNIYRQGLNQAIPKYRKPARCSVYRPHHLFSPVRIQGLFQRGRPWQVAQNALQRFPPQAEGHKGQQKEDFKKQENFIHTQAP